ncbi:hypothetical protein [Alkalicoccobacillus porphyridii]|uniref:Uncharacterized protein n=1 Tax=Alkalicoccobacillus porphyridii TaxID=2597270 RepID=A0A553ZX12_9BACI|nr:hypothetical protein [Alkalicoccobacillus porphyridii]TSB45886.1 hypothetical protein FN960_13295 [Alkalicoccobacillus porphyridii]
MTEVGVNFDLSSENLGGIHLKEDVNNLDEILLEEVPVEYIKYKKVYIYDNKVEVAVDDKRKIKKVSVNKYYDGEEEKLNYHGV